MLHVECKEVQTVSDQQRPFESDSMELVAPLPARSRLVDTVYERLRDAILNGEIEPGEKLSVPALALGLDVSRSPVVAAVQRLIQEGLAVEKPRKGAVVTLISVPELIRLYEIREVLEGLAARLAAERVTPEMVEDMGNTLARHEAAIVGEDQAIRQLENVNFHRAIRDAAGHPELARWLEAIQSQVKLAMRRTGVYMYDVELTVREHRAILEAIQRREPDTAERVARVHIRRVREKLALVDVERRVKGEAVA
jgi:DNA-binding GntR family transcriptional regulator